MPAKKKPTMKEMEKVTSNIIHDLQIINKKTDGVNWALNVFIDLLGKTKEFNEKVIEIRNNYEKEQNERAESDKASSKTDSSKITK